jgi:hypothetical protein
MQPVQFSNGYAADRKPAQPADPQAIEIIAVGASNLPRPFVEYDVPENGKCGAGETPGRAEGINLKTQLNHKDTEAQREETQEM